MRNMISTSSRRNLRLWPSQRRPVQSHSRWVKIPGFSPCCHLPVRPILPYPIFHNHSQPLKHLTAAAEKTKMAPGLQQPQDLHVEDLAFRPGTTRSHPHPRAALSGANLALSPPRLEIHVLPALGPKTLAAFKFSPVSSDNPHTHHTNLEPLLPLLFRFSGDPKNY